MLIGEILGGAAQNVFVGGNLGTPLIEAADGKFDVAVVEVSSYQLEWIEKFKPRVGIHLNLTDDHLDRYRRPRGVRPRQGAAVRESGRRRLGDFESRRSAMSGSSRRACARE